MSALPIGLPLETGGAPSRFRALEIVTTRGQRRGRPRLVVAIVTVAGLFAILAAQLLLSIATSEGAYEISSLQARQSELARDQQVMAESLRVLEAPQHLSAEAQAMGMVANSSAAYLRLVDGAVLGVPAAASASAALRTADDGSSLIPNSLLSEVPLVAVPGQTGATDAPGEGPVGAPAAPGEPSTPPTVPAGIPTPTTH
ncbi:MAG: hypothetical protein RI885_1504 [Actinomycetota bacterium]